MSLFDKESARKAARAALNPYIQHITVEVYDAIVDAVAETILKRQEELLRQVILHVAKISGSIEEQKKAVDTLITGK